MGNGAGRQVHGNWIGKCYAAIIINRNTGRECFSPAAGQEKAAVIVKSNFSRLQALALIAVNVKIMSICIKNVSTS